MLLSKTSLSSLPPPPEPPSPESISIEVTVTLAGILVSSGSSVSYSASASQRTGYGSGCSDSSGHGSGGDGGPCAVAWGLLRESVSANVLGRDSAVVSFCSSGFVSSAVGAGVGEVLGANGFDAAALDLGANGLTGLSAG